MSYILDSNVFISAATRHYKFAFMPGFWDWVLKEYENKEIFSAKYVGEELYGYGDDLSDWAKQHRYLFLEPTKDLPKSLSTISEWAEKSNRTELAKRKFLASEDYKIIAFAHSLDWTLVTEERPEPNQVSKVKIPDVCNELNIKWISPWDLLESKKAKFILS